MEQRERRTADEGAARGDDSFHYAMAAILRLLFGFGLVSSERLASRPLRPAVASPRARAPVALLGDGLQLQLLCEEAAAGGALALDPGVVAGVVAVGVLGYLFATNQLWNPTTGAILPLLFLSGDSEKLAESGATTEQNEALKKFALSVTPSAWKKAYSGVDDSGQRLDPVTGEMVDGPPPLLDLPTWQGEEARALVEPEAVACVKSMRFEPIEVPGVGPVNTCFMSLRPEKPADAPPLLLIHGFDSSLLEFRYVTPKLVAAGLRVEAMEWWTGGFTERGPFTEAVAKGAKPWDLVRDHQYAFWKRQLGGEKAVVLGASLGGSVARG